MRRSLPFFSVQFDELLGKFAEMELALKATESSANPTKSWGNTVECTHYGRLEYSSLESDLIVFN